MPNHNYENPRQYQIDKERVHRLQHKEKDEISYFLKRNVIKYHKRININ